MMFGHEEGCIGCSSIMTYMLYIARWQEANFVYHRGQCARGIRAARKPKEANPIVGPVYMS